MCAFNNLKKVESLMNFGYLNFGTKDAVLVIAIFDKVHIIV
ncbi:hypothetical protein HMPREF9519_01997 [Enterococcus faecalis TX1346]|nr:hypothetical protein HMPREF9519_01997 [Enterococcus faecalis TX1346]